MLSSRLGTMLNDRIDKQLRLKKRLNEMMTAPRHTPSVTHCLNGHTGRWETPRQRELKNKHVEGRMNYHVDTTKRARQLELPREP
jgi:hypothetical protein